MKSIICYLSKSDDRTVDNLKTSLNKLYKNYKLRTGYIADVVKFKELLNNK